MIFHSFMSNAHDPGAETLRTILKRQAAGALIGVSAHALPLPVVA